MTLAALLLLADLQIASVKPVKPALTTDETFTVAVKVHNSGPEAAKDVKVTLGVNALSYLKSAAGPKGWTCEQGPVFGYALVCTAPSLASEADAELTLTLASPQHSAMTYRVGGRVQSATEDGTAADDRKEQAMIIEATKANAELSLTANVEANQINVEVKNAGPHDAKDVMVVLSEAKKLDFKASGHGWKCNGAVCTRPLLKAGTSASLKVASVAKATLSMRVRAEKNRESAKDNAAKVTLP
jgi:Domain of unknown function DUF11